MIDMESIWRVISWEWEGGEWGERVRGLRSIIGRYKIGNVKGIGTVKNSIGNGEAKELICTTHGHDLRGRIA